ncbi:hypothetical protein [Actinomadura rupiterrae]|uniref:hypothetical protein n=1 Tax=Actinomadura rupiterrae TaxID=559627 RepID=UPI0020A3453E|nr:hypothetical protein [Actinomadura rupiterrae]MCP2338897.1 hypothetical protein [Actinomadura rupiterrae]
MNGDDDRLVEDLYNRAVVRVYSGWASSSATWMPARERSLAGERVRQARAKLDVLAATAPRAPEPEPPTRPDGPVRWNADD